eukprot:evm.model.NODE_19601_length_21504_cov_34.674339.3
MSAESFPPSSLPPSFSSFGVMSDGEIADSREETEEDEEEEDKDGTGGLGAWAKREALMGCTDSTTSELAVESNHARSVA